MLGHIAGFLFLLLSSVEGLKCNDGQIRGVNAGGWLLLEPWMTPDLFNDLNSQASGNCIDEYTTAQFVPHDYYRERMKQHWDTFFSREELARLADTGISHIRIPVGYWTWDVAADEPFPAPNMDDNDPYSALFYLKRMLTWIEDLDMIALIDLHGVPGSQNGFDNSGRAGAANWVNWGMVPRTKDILGKIVRTLRGWVDSGTIQSRTLYGMELVNEPGGWDDNIWNALKDDYYPNGYHVVRDVFPDNSFVVNVQQAFKPGPEFNGMLNEPDFHAVSVDMHVYQCFGDYWNSIHVDTEAGRGVHYDASCAYANEVAQMNKWTFTGEWSLGHAGPWNWNDATYTQFLRLWFLAQIDAFEYTNNNANGVGWFFWNWKIQGGYPEWSYQYLLDNGIAPQNLCQRETFCIFQTDNEGNLVSTSYNKTMAGATQN